MIWLPLTACWPISSPRIPMIPPSPERNLAHERNPSHASTKHSNPHRVIGAVVATGIMSFLRRDCGDGLVHHIPGPHEPFRYRDLQRAMDDHPLPAGRRLHHPALSGPQTPIPQPDPLSVRQPALPGRPGHRRAGSVLPPPAAGQGHTGSGHQHRPPP